MMFGVLMIPHLKYAYVLLVPFSFMDSGYACLLLFFTFVVIMFCGQSGLNEIK